MSTISRVASTAAAYRPAKVAAPKPPPKSEEAAESPAQEAAEGKGGRLDVKA